MFRSFIYSLNIQHQNTYAADILVSHFDVYWNDENTNHANIMSYFISIYGK